MVRRGRRGSAAAAAVGEELLVVVLLALLLRAAGVSITRIILVALALRLSYHLYYGWQSTFVLGWGAVFVALYLWRGWIWPQLIAHFVFDMINGVRLPDWLYQLAWAAAFLIPIGCLVAVRWRLRRSRLSGFNAWQRNGGEAALRADLVGATNGAFPVVVSARRALLRLAVTRGRKDGNYQVKVGPGIQQLSTGERDALVAREAAVNRLGHAAYDATRARRERRRTAAAAAVLVAGFALAGVVAVRFNAHTGAWLVLLIYLAILAVLYRAAAAEAARSRAGTFAADRAAVQSVGAPRS